jgi:hypothetical protein
VSLHKDDRGTELRTCSRGGSSGGRATLKTAGDTKKAGDTTKSGLGVSTS